MLQTPDSFPVAAKLATCCVLIFVARHCDATSPWVRHVIDGSMRGADGVRLADFDGDGNMDVVTGWEESGTVMLYLNPGPSSVTKPWPSVLVGKAKSPEDAVPFDANGDGNIDVVSCHEGKERRVFIHTNSTDSSRRSLLDKATWVSEPVDVLDGQMWMFAEPISIPAVGDALIVASKGKGASISLLMKIDGQWNVQRLRDAGWIMTLKSVDMDADGDQDLVYSDRKGTKRGVGWLEQPSDPATHWKDHMLGLQNAEPMFVDASEDRIIVSTRNGYLEDFSRRSGRPWKSVRIPNPPGVEFGKAVRRLTPTQLAMTANTAADKKSEPEKPAFWLWKSEDNSWHVIDPILECKFDRIEAIDLDGDGDLDLMTCEERKNLGVVWYENPMR